MPNCTVHGIELVLPVARIRMDGQRTLRPFAMLSRARERRPCRVAVPGRAPMVSDCIPSEVEHMSSVRQGWVIGGAVVVLLVLVSSYYNGTGTHYRPAGTAAA